MWATATTASPAAGPGARVAAWRYVTFTVFSPDLMLLDLTNLAQPALAGVYDLGIEQAQKTIDFVDESGSGYTHSLSVSAAVVPGRQDVVLTQEDYANAGHGCPFGILRTGRLGSDGGATLEGQFALPENDPRTCGSKNGTFSSHNPTLFHDLGLVTWRAAGRRPHRPGTPVGARRVRAPADLRPRPSRRPPLCRDRERPADGAPAVPGGGPEGAAGARLPLPVAVALIAECLRPRTAPAQRVRARRSRRGSEPTSVRAGCRPRADGSSARRALPPPR